MPGTAAPPLDKEPEARLGDGLSDVINNSPRSVAQRKLAKAMTHSPRVAALRALRTGLNKKPHTVGQHRAAQLRSRNTLVGGAVVQGLFEWLWAALGYGGGAPAGPAGPAAVAPGPAAAAAAVPVAPAPAAPTPADIRARLRAAEGMYSAAARTLPAAIRQPWATNDPAPVANRIHVVYAPLHGLAAFPHGRAALADQDATTIEQQAATYRDYCAAVLPDLQRACAQRAAYLPELTVADTLLFTQLCAAVELGTEMVAQTRLRCSQFIEAARASSVLDSDGLYALMVGNPVRAQQLVTQYFAQGRVRIGKWRIGYASEFDANTNAFGAEWTLRAPNGELKDIADQWVFHTHAICDPALNFTISRAMGASHIKRAQDAMALGVSINFVDDAEFSRVEKDTDTQRSFTSWVRRDGAHALRNTKKR